MSYFDNILFIPHQHGQKKQGVEDVAFFIKPVIKKSINILELEKKDNIITSLNHIYDYCHKYNKRSLFIGGDHSIAIGTIKAIYEENMKIIWIDAHADINTMEASMTKNVHGMPLAFLTGLEENFLNCPGRENITVPFENIAYIGIRSIDDFEKNLIKEKNIKVIDHNKDIESIKKELNEFIGNSSIHISFDVDVLDPEFMQCTGTREPNGISLDHLLNIFDILKTHNVNSMDIVEFNHAQGKNKEEFTTSLKSLLSVMQKFKVLSTTITD
tara:strand:+ start:2172 stop:2984 length:813 start_codon:yes stop_codon:yes gene_type:complete